ncbi:MAG: alpha/beta hydrolase [Bacteroidota bacterium]|nr:alpha/beta hydrolase [Bacteroidota bacterium]
MIKTEGKFNYLEVGEGSPIILLHGLMGSIENFGDMVDYISKDYKVYGLDLKLFETPLLKCSVKNLAKYLRAFMKHINVEKAVLLGNSMGGHIGLIFAKLYPEKVSGLILTGSSGLYENSLGDTYPRRGDYNYIKTKTEEVFYDPKTATKELVDSVFEIANKRASIIRLLAFAKSAIRHNMANDLPSILVPSLLIWGHQDKVTPPNVAKEFHKLLPNSELEWIDLCGHAPMWEHPKRFSEIILKWLNIYF